MPKGYAWHVFEFTVNSVLMVLFLHFLLKYRILVVVLSPVVNGDRGSNPSFSSFICKVGRTFFSTYLIFLRFGLKLGLELVSEIWLFKVSKRKI